jgi:hypothetical protein
MRLSEKGVKPKRLLQIGLTVLMLVAVIVVGHFLNTYQAGLGNSSSLPSFTARGYHLLARGAEKSEHPTSTIEDGKPLPKMNQGNKNPHLHNNPLVRATCNASGAMLAYFTRQ